MTTFQRVFALSFLVFTILFTFNAVEAQNTRNSSNSSSSASTGAIVPSILGGLVAKGNTADSQSIDLSDLKEGFNVVAQTREHILLAVRVEKGRLVGIGTINRKGGFNPLLPNGPCSDYIVQPCADGSAPVGYYDPYLKKCVAYCDGFIDVDPIYQPLRRPYGLLPDGPCSDWIAQPCPSGGTLVTYYDPYTKKCVAMCDF